MALKILFILRGCLVRIEIGSYFGEQLLHRLLNFVIFGNSAAKIDKCYVEGNAVGRFEAMAVEPVGLACASAQEHAVNGVLETFLGDGNEKLRRLLLAAVIHLPHSAQWE